MYAHLICEKASPAVGVVYTLLTMLFSKTAERLYTAALLVWLMIVSRTELIQPALQTIIMAEFWPTGNIWAILKQKIGSKKRGENSAAAEKQHSNCLARDRYRLGALSATYDVPVQESFHHHHKNGS